MDFTVAIPTYNGASTLPLVLERLQRQINTEKINWEVIVIDNNSNDNTSQVIEQFMADWNTTIPLKYFFEQTQGMAYARWRAIKEAKGKFVGFLDDDNLAAHDWVYQSYLFGIENPKLGAYGGEIVGKFEVEPPEDFDRAKTFLAIRKYASIATIFEVDKLRLPPGAGLVVRKKAWLQSVPSVVTQTQRGCEDYEISLYMHNHNWEIWYNPAMQIQHLIPAWRMQKNYLVNIARIYGMSTYQLRLMTVKADWQKPFLTIKIFLGALKRIIFHLLKYRSKVNSNLGIACEMSLYLGQIISPFYYLKR
ncbi:hormogonium polysaccharide biosynthesis glycosyltransferase HpsE [Calothrix sp. NIES-2098]|uniref:hormogonium polysaccharide biosynthesis glycosyltransferase HpsE n=1 Tax=Calothrix sp. NIES-2098 TaxID=1954171 RepID=UPI000B5DDD87|nr:glycosyl transferase family protein [Calothrix sp. NIES-2098]